MTALEEFYTVGKWADMDNYECKLCPFSSLSLPDFQEHFLNRHAPDVTQPSGQVLIADRRGRDVTHTKGGNHG